MDKTSILLDKFIGYAKKNFELSDIDEVLIRNRLMEALEISGYDGRGNASAFDCEKTGELLDDLHAFLREKGKDSAEFSEYDDIVMGILLPNPSVLNKRFSFLSKKPEKSFKATDYLYRMGVKSNYIKKEQLDANPRFLSNGLVITINRTKPEFRDPKKAASGTAVAGGYPKCTICRDNEGLPLRQKRTLRTAHIKLDGENWFWQFSPFGYFNEHGIAVNCEHIPMHVDVSTIRKLLDFVDMFPHYFIGCNAALPRIGGSVLAHDHFQGGRETLPLHTAAVKIRLDTGSSNSFAGILDWPGTAVRIVSRARDEITRITGNIIEAWGKYENTDLGLVNKDSEGVHHAVSPTVRINKKGEYEASVILRSNITSEKYPDGVFHSHPEFHVIKKESIGLIEAQGLFILPGRLVEQLDTIKSLLISGSDLPGELSDFEFVFNELRTLYPKPAGEAEAETAVKKELGSICYRILENTAVFKKERDFLDFLELAGLHS